MATKPKDMSGPDWRTATDDLSQLERGMYGTDLPVMNDSDPHFDVTMVVGRVYLSEHGTADPHKVALGMIWDRQVEGTFQFPTADGRVASVTVEFSNG